MKRSNGYSYQNAPSIPQSRQYHVEDPKARQSQAMVNTQSSGTMPRQTAPTVRLSQLSDEEASVIFNNRKKELFDILLNKMKRSDSGSKLLRQMSTRSMSMSGLNKQGTAKNNQAQNSQINSPRNNIDSNNTNSNNNYNNSSPVESSPKKVKQKPAATYSRQQTQSPQPQHLVKTPQTSSQGNLIIQYVNESPKIPQQPIQPYNQSYSSASSLSPSKHVSANNTYAQQPEAIRRDNSYGALSKRKSITPIKPQAQTKYVNVNPSNQIEVINDFTQAYATNRVRSSPNLAMLDSSTKQSKQKHSASPPTTTQMQLLASQTQGNAITTANTTNATSTTYPLSLSPETSKRNPIIQLIKVTDKQNQYNTQLLHQREKEILKNPPLLILKPSASAISVRNDLLPAQSNMLTSKQLNPQVSQQITANSYQKQFEMKVLKCSALTSNPLLNNNNHFDSENKSRKSTTTNNNSYNTNNPNHQSPFQESKQQLIQQQQQPSISQAQQMYLSQQQQLRVQLNSSQEQQPITPLSIRSQLKGIPTLHSQSPQRTRPTGSETQPTYFEDEQLPCLKYSSSILSDDNKPSRHIQKQGSQMSLQSQQQQHIINQNQNSLTPPDGSLDASSSSMSEFLVLEATQSMQQLSSYYSKDPSPKKQYQLSKKEDSDDKTPISPASKQLGGFPEDDQDNLNASVRVWIERALDINKDSKKSINFSSPQGSQMQAEIPNGRVLPSNEQQSPLKQPIKLPLKSILVNGRCTSPSKWNSLTNNSTSQFSVQQNIEKEEFELESTHADNEDKGDLSDNNRGSGAIQQLKYYIGNSQSLMSERTKGHGSQVSLEDSDNPMYQSTQNGVAGKIDARQSGQLVDFRPKLATNGTVVTNVSANQHKSARNNLELKASIQKIMNDSDGIFSKVLMNQAAAQKQKSDRNYNVESVNNSNNCSSNNMKNNNNFNSSLQDTTVTPRRFSTPHIRSKQC